MLEAIVGIIGVAVGGGLTLLGQWYSTRQAGKMAEEQWRFTVTKSVSERALDVLGESYHLTHEINRCIHSKVPDNKDIMRDLNQRIIDARIYWEKHLFYLPVKVRGRIIGFTNRAMYAMIKVDEPLPDDLLEQVKDIMTEIEVAFNDIMGDYNLWNELGSGLKR